MLDVFFFYNYAIVVECEYYPNIQYVLDQNKSTCEEVFQNESVWPITVFNIENVIATETSPVVILYMRGVDITCHEYLVKLMTSYNNESGYESGTCVFHTEDDMKSGIVKCIYNCTFRSDSQNTLESVVIQYFICLTFSSDSHFT